MIKNLTKSKLHVSSSLNYAELAELKLTADYINHVSSQVKFNRISKNPAHKGILIELPFTEFSISAETKGKEMVMYFTDSLNTKTKPIPMRITMGMAGCFRMTPIGDEPKHSHLMFHTTDSQTLSFVDVRRFGKWKLGYSWSDNRGPDPMVEYDAFCNNINQNLEKAVFRKPLFEMMMDQKYFNGIGNYLRAEIIYHAKDVNPFLPANQQLKANPKILDLCHQITQLAYVRGGGCLHDWKNPFDETLDAKGFMLCYGNYNMCQMVDKHKRRFWYDPKWNQ